VPQIQRCREGQKTGRLFVTRLSCQDAQKR
jgi:hypothetical protein